MKTLLIFIMAAVVSTPAQAEPINLAGIDMSMTREQKLEILSHEGYECINGRDNYSAYFLCSDGDKIISYDPTMMSLTFSCAIFGACRFPVREFAQAIVDNKIVSELEYGSLETLEGYVDKYCGYGPDKDRLCLFAKLRAIEFQSPNAIVLFKGALGEKGITFD